MTKLISLSLGFPEGAPPAKLLQELLESEINAFFHAKLIRMGTMEASLDIGQFSLKQLFATPTLLPDEWPIAPGITALSALPDVADQARQFLVQPSPPARFGATLVGDYRLDYVWNGESRGEWAFRYGSDRWRQLVLRLALTNYGPPPLSSHGSVVFLTTHCPWFFLRDWWLDTEPRYSRRDVAERNWNRLVDFARLVIDVANENKLERVYLSLEGAGPFEERDWLLETARRLPRLHADL